MICLVNVVMVVVVVVVVLVVVDVSVFEAQPLAANVSACQSFGLFKDVAHLGNLFALITRTNQTNQWRIINLETSKSN